MNELEKQQMLALRERYFALKVVRDNIINRRETESAAAQVGVDIALQEVDKLIHGLEQAGITG